MPRLALILAAAGLVAVAPLAVDDHPFSSTTIDLGMVVKDVEASAAFYTDVLGFTEVPGFTAPSELCVAAGLTDGPALEVRVVKLGEGDKATSLKMMQCPEANPGDNDPTYIPSEYGFRYLTVYVTNLGKHLEHLAKHDVKPLAEGPVALTEEGPRGAHLATVRDPDGNLVELIGPLEVE